MTRAPVLLLIFNRPDFAAASAQAIVRNQPSKLYVACDGPRDIAEAEVVEATQRAVLDAADGAVEVVTLFRDRNLGCKRAVEEGISWFLSQESEGIIVEDDCIPSPSFFEFCDEMLERYRDEPRVMHISGYCHAPADVPGYRFSQFPAVWGWATWQRAWQHYPVQIPPMTTQRRLELRSAFASKEEHGYFVAKFDQVAKGKLDTWDFSWSYTLFARQAVAVQPNLNLVRNVGVGDPRAAHTTRRRADITDNVEGEMDSIDLPWPFLLLPDFANDQAFFRTMIAGRHRHLKRIARAARFRIGRQ